MITHFKILYFCCRFDDCSFSLVLLFHYISLCDPFLKWSKLWAVNFWSWWSSVPLLLLIPNVTFAHKIKQVLAYRIRIIRQRPALERFIYLQSLFGLSAIFSVWNDEEFRAFYSLWPCNFLFHNSWKLPKFFKKEHWNSLFT